MSAVREVAEELLAAARAVSVAVDDENEAVLQEALERRQAAYDRLQSHGLGTPEPEVRRILAEVAEVDAQSVELARSGLAQVRSLLEESATARRAIQALRSSGEPPRFVTRRV